MPGPGLLRRPAPPSQPLQLRRWVLAASPILAQRTGDTWGHDHYLDHRREQGTWARDGTSAAGDRPHRTHLVNNAGTPEPRVGAADLTAEEAMNGFGINVFGPIRGTHALLP